MLSGLWESTGNTETSVTDPRSNHVRGMKCPKQREACGPKPEDRQEVELFLDNEGGLQRLTSSLRG